MTETEIIVIDTIRKQAEEAADDDRGPQANPYPEGSMAAKRWLGFYYSRIHKNAEAVVA